MTEKILKKREKKILRQIEKGAHKADTAIVKKPRKIKASKEAEETIDNN